MADRICTNCGSQVGPNDRFCNNCGQALADQPGAAKQQGAFIAPPMPENPPAETGAFTPPPEEATQTAFTPPDQDSLPPAFTPPDQDSAPPAFTPPPAAEEQSGDEPVVPPPPAFTPPPAAARPSIFGSAATPQRAEAAAPEPPSTPPPAFNPPPAARQMAAAPVPPPAAAPLRTPPPMPAGAGAPPKKKSSAGCIIGGCVGLLIIAILIVVLIIAVIIPRLGDPTTLIETGATAIFRTSVSSGSATRTPASAATGATLLEDDFNSASGWDEWEEEESVGAYENNKYTIEVLVPDTFYWSVAGEDFSDYSISVDTTKLTGVDDNHYGLILRYQDNANFYMFSISSDGYYQFGYYEDDEWTSLVEWTETSVIKQGNALNRIAIQANGEDFIPMINDKEVDSVSDSTFGSGDIGLFAGSSDDAPVKIAFDNLEVNRIR